MEIIVFGAGSLGSLIGGMLAGEHDVTLVGRNPHVRAIQTDGLTITGAFQRTVAPRATTSVPSTAELAIVTVKAYDTPAAATALRDCDCSAILSLQNGMGNETTLSSTLDATVLAGTATYGAMQDEPGTVRCTGEGAVVLGPYDGGSNPVADRVGAAFRTAGIETTVATDMPTRLWEKLAVNAAINATTALARVPNGALSDGPAREIAREAAREAAEVARSNDVELADDDAIAALERVVEATAENDSSMYRDVAERRRTEVNAINGVPADSEVETPINDTLASLLRAWERKRELR